MLSQDNLFFGQTPIRVVIGLVDVATFNGSYKANSFNFQTFCLTYLSLLLGARVLTGQPLTMDYDLNTCQLYSALI